ncbi:MAG TPA: TraR/DksA C4-type zinc finger protein [Streptosporangiaceae bacterium]|nr:TraR/DksA C4-type zinc finger protein [Streptosporangiaceae bacterium]
MDTGTARKRLEEMRDDLDRSIAVLKGEHPADDAASGYPADPADAGTNLSEADRTLAILEAAQDQRSQVLEALDRLDGGKYGTCAECGKLVPDGRLEARPEAARCVACQSRADRLRR